MDNDPQKTCEVWEMAVIWEVTERILGDRGDLRYITDNCLLALRGYPGVFASGASVSLARGRIGNVAVRGRVGGLLLGLVQSAMRCH